MQFFPVPFTLSLPAANIFLITLFSDTLSVRDQASDP